MCHGPEHTIYRTRAYHTTEKKRRKRVSRTTIDEFLPAVFPLASVSLIIVIAATTRFLDIQRLTSLVCLSSSQLQNLSLIESIALRDTATGVAQTFDRSVVRPASELLLHGLTEHGSLDVAVCGRLAGELLVEVGRVALVEHGRLERRLVLAVEKLAPVDAVEEGVCL